MYAPYIIKPEGMEYSSQIHDIFKKNGLRVLSYKTIKFTEKIVDHLYDNLDPPVRRAVHKMLVGESCEIGIVEGKGAPRVLREICGTETDPSLCRDGTIRKSFGNENGIPLSGGYVYYINIIHRAKNKRELKSDLRLILKLIS